MPSLKMSLCLLCALVLAAVGLQSPRGAQALGAEAALASKLASASAIDKVGEFYWLENDGLATKLAPAPLAPAKGLALLASDVRQSRPAAALWRLDERGMAPLAARLKANTQPASDYAASTANNVQVSGKQLEMTLGNGLRGLLTVIALGSRQYALALTAPGGVGDSLTDRRDEIIAQLHVIVAPEEELVAPLLLEGRYAGRLVGYSRKGRRFEQRNARGWISVSMFTVAGAEYANRDSLQFELEQRLKAQGLRRTGGDTPNNAWGVEAYCGQYFTQGHISRILYARLGGDYLVALFHGNEAAREQLETESMRFAGSVRPTGLTPRAPPPRRALAQAGAMEVMAWQEGTGVQWGALFERPWREAQVRYIARVTQNGRELAETSGEAASSQDFNPLGTGGPRRLNLPGDARGEVQFELRVGAASASIKLTLR